MSTYSGHIEANQGFNGPETFDGPKCWTVNKMQQTEIFKVQHGLNLASPRHMRVAVTTDKSQTIANVESITANDFTVSVWTLNGAPAMTGFAFVAVTK